MSQDSAAKKADAPIELDLTASVEIQTSADSLSSAPASAPGAGAGAPTLELVASEGEMVIEGNGAPTAATAESMVTSGSVELSLVSDTPEPVQMPTPEPVQAATPELPELSDGNDNLLASSLEAALKAVEAKGKTSAEEAEDQAALPTVEIPIPAKGLKVVSMTGEARVMVAPPVATPPAVTPANIAKEATRTGLTANKEATRTGLKLGVAPKAAAGVPAPMAAPRRGAAFISKARDRLEPLMARLAPLLGKIFKAPEASDGVEIPAFMLSRPAIAIFVVLALGLGGYGYSIRQLHHEGPHGAWNAILKSWKKSDLTGIKEIMSIGVEDAPLIMVSRYPELVQTSESEFGTLIKRFHKARVKAYENEFRKGFGSAFWDMNMLEMVAYGDRFEVVYAKERERVTFILERFDEDWKLVDIDATNAKNIFVLDLDEVKTEETP